MPILGTKAEHEQPENNKQTSGSNEPSEIAMVKDGASGNAKHHETEGLDSTYPGWQAMAEVDECGRMLLS